MSAPVARLEQPSLSSTVDGLTRFVSCTSDMQDIIIILIGTVEGLHIINKYIMEVSVYTLYH